MAEDILPNRGSVEGGYSFTISLTEKLPDEVMTVVVHFEGLGNVTARKLEPFIIWSGIIPPSSGPVRVPVVVTTNAHVPETSHSQFSNDEYAELVRWFMNNHPTLQAEILARLAKARQDWFPLESNSLSHCQWLYDTFSHHGLAQSWCFTLMQKEVPAFIKFLTSGETKGLSKRLLGMFTYLAMYDEETKSLPPPEPLVLRAMICTGMPKEICPLPQTVLIHPAIDYLVALAIEADVVPDDEIMRRPVFRVHGDCEECQRLLKEYPANHPVVLDKTEVIDVLMPVKWSEPVDYNDYEDNP